VEGANDLLEGMWRMSKQESDFALGTLAKSLEQPPQFSSPFSAHALYPMARKKVSSTIIRIASITSGE
jgi:hypothetical protein